MNEEILSRIVEKFSACGERQKIAAGKALIAHQLLPVAKIVSAIPTCSGEAQSTSTRRVSKRKSEFGESKK